MKLIVGLGNIGREYENTRHNIGFMVVDELARRLGVSFGKEDRSAYMAEYRAPEKIIIIKPTTYMNLSGNAVRYWMNKENIPVENILVLVDDIALPFGAIRIKGSGSDAGHNGLKNIAQMLGTEAYPRLRFGLGNDFPRGCQIDYVLGQFTLDERQRLPVRVATAVEAIRTYVLAGLQTAMCDFNNK